MVEYDPNYRKIKPGSSSSIFYKIASIVLGIILVFGTVFLMFRDQNLTSNKEIEFDGLALSDISSIGESDSTIYDIEARLDSCLIDCKAKLGVSDNNFRVRITKDESGLSEIYQKKVYFNISSAFPMAHINQIVHGVFRERGFEIIEGIEIIPGKKIIIKAGDNGSITHILTLSRRSDIEPEIGYVALLIGGYGEEQELNKLLDLKDKFTAAIVPDKENSSKHYEGLRETNAEIYMAISLNSEAEKNVNASTENDIKRQMERAYRDYPEADGITNFFDRKPSQNQTTLVITVQESHRDSIFYIQNLIGNYPQTDEIIVKDGFSFAPIDYIIDINDASSGSGASKLFDYSFSSRFSEPGVIIGIYIDEDSEDLVFENINRLKKLGIRFISVSEMIRRKRNWQSSRKSTAS